MEQTVEQASAVIPDSAAKEVVKALENPKYVWRTPKGISKETKLPEDEVATALNHISPDVLVTTTGRQGQLYTTRNHYYKTQSFLGRFLTAATGRFK